MSIEDSRAIGGAVPFLCADKTRAEPYFTTTHESTVRWPPFLHTSTAHQGRLPENLTFSASPRDTCTFSASQARSIVRVALNSPWKLRHRVGGSACLSSLGEISNLSATRPSERSLSNSAG